MACFLRNSIFLAVVGCRAWMQTTYDQARLSKRAPTSICSMPMMPANVARDYDIY